MRRDQRQLYISRICLCAILCLSLEFTLQTTWTLPQSDASTSSLKQLAAMEIAETDGMENKIHEYGDLLGDSKIYAYDFVPPLSIDDSIYLIRAAILLLEPETRKYVSLDRPKLIQMLKINESYIQLLDNRYSTLRHYSWIDIGTQKVAIGGKDRDEYRPSALIKNVSAIAVRVGHADVMLELMEVWDVNRDCINLEVKGQIFPHGKPARDVIFLNRQVTLERLILTAVSVDIDKEASITIEVGITPEPEHAKYAIYEINSARESLQEAGDEEAIDNLKNAWRHLNFFKEQVNL